jgi:hypothetical protein
MLLDYWKVGYSLTLIKPNIPLAEMFILRLLCRFPHLNGLGNRYGSLDIRPSVITLSWNKACPSTDVLSCNHSDIKV